MKIQNARLFELMHAQCGYMTSLVHLQGSFIIFGNISTLKGGIIYYKMHTVSL